MARSLAVERLTVSPVRSAGSATTRETSTPSLAISRRMKAPNSSAPVRPKKAVSSPSRAAPQAMITEELPGVSSASLTTISWPKTGAMVSSCKIRSTLISPTTSRACMAQLHHRGQVGGRVGV